MKRIKTSISLGLLFTIMAPGSFAQTAQDFVVNGKLKAAQPGKVYLAYQAEGKRVSDSTSLTNGIFSFKGKIVEPTMATIYFGKSLMAYDAKNTMRVYLEPGKVTINTIADHLDQAKVLGGKTQREHQEYEQMVGRIRDQWQGVMDTLSAINKRSNFAFQETKAWVLKPYYAAMGDANAAFIGKYPDSYKTLDLITSWAGFSEISLDSLKKLQAALPSQLKNSVGGKALVKTLAELTEKSKIGAVGSIAANFNKPDINGKQLSLADYKGKYVLLDFWASWCVPCRKGNPHLITLYNKYKDQGFEIIGVSDDDRNHTAWKQAVEKDQIGIWKHVLRGLDMEKRMKGAKNENDLSEAYNVSTLPSKFLIDPKGVIIGRYVEGKEDDEKLDKKLAEAFK